ncbi:hypothetical protein [Acetivibrio cellulolyticus]|uniref:hypothetical protein n=1 Tax=Acetivibrio cellulolyticus TaxID=35830 RepID=UPI0001E2C744|nr:hypothetical protein [Acetivibrio cellulolyticus]
MKRFLILALCLLLIISVIESKSGNSISISAGNSKLPALELTKDNVVQLFLPKLKQTYNSAYVTFLVGTVISFPYIMATNAIYYEELMHHCTILLFFCKCN